MGAKDPCAAQRGIGRPVLSAAHLLALEDGDAGFWLVGLLGHGTRSAVTGKGVKVGMNKIEG